MHVQYEFLTRVTLTLYWSFADKFEKSAANDFGHGAKRSFSGSRVTRGTHKLREMTASRNWLVTQSDAVWRRVAAANIEKFMVAELNTKHCGSPRLQQVLA